MCAPARLCLPLPLHNRRAHIFPPADSLAALRLCAAKFGADRAPPLSGTTLLRRFHAARRAVLAPGAVKCTDYLEPFLDTIRQEDTSGVVTQRALCAVRAFLESGLLTLDPLREPAAIVSIVHAATFCRFEVTDPAADEVVLMSILQLLVTCVRCPSGGALSDEAVCEVVHSCFRISSQASLSDLLRHEAEAGLRSMVRTLFLRIPAITAADPVGAQAGASDLASTPPVAARTPWAGQQVAAAAAAKAAEARTGEASRSRASDLPTITQQPSSEEAGTEPSAEPVTLDRPPSEAFAPDGAPPVERGAVTEVADDTPPPSTPPPKHHSGAAAAAAAIAAAAAAAPVDAAGGNAAAGADGAPAVPYGVGCLYEVLRFLVGLIDPTEPHNPPPVRAFALAALLAAMMAGGKPLGGVSALSSLLADSLTYAPPCSPPVKICAMPAHRP